MFGISCKLRPSKYSIMHGWKIPQSSKIFPSELWWILEWGCLVKCSGWPCQAVSQMTQTCFPLSFPAAVHGLKFVKKSVVFYVVMNTSPKNTCICDFQVEKTNPFQIFSEGIWIPVSLVVKQTLLGGYYSNHRTCITTATTFFFQDPKHLVLHGISMVLP